MNTPSMTRPLRFLSIVLALLALAACGGGDSGSGGGSVPDTTPPTVLSAVPANSATGIAVNTTVSVNFSETMNCVTVNASSVTLASTGGSVTGSVTCSGSSATFTPNSDLAYSMSYTLTVSTAVKDNAGNALASVYTSTFTTAAAPTPTTYTIGGNLSGLGSGKSVTLQNNGGDNLNLTTNGSFTFATAITSGAAYNVTVLTQPLGQTCGVTTGSGTATGDVTGVAVVCTTNTYTIGGTVSGLGSSKSVMLQNNGGDNLNLTANGSFTFATAIPSGAGYSIDVLTQPAGQACVVASGSGVVGTANVSTVQVTCATNPPASSTVIPASGARINGATTIKITFDRSMSTGSLVMSGALASEASGSWSQTSLSNDTLTISPVTTWSQGSGRTLTVEAQDSTDIPISTLNLAYDVDTVAPTVTNTNPANASPIGSGQQVKVVFGESMDTASLTLGGSMVSESNGGVWSTTTVANDTLTVSPSVAWTPGSKTLTVSANDVAGNPLNALNLTYTVDTSVPTATVSPTNGNNISSTATIVVSFSKTMATGSLVKSGTLAGQGHTATWSTTALTNDTLTIAPSTVWTKGLQTLSLTAPDLIGNSISLNLSFGVDSVFVRTTGNDSNPGTSSQPRASIQGGIARASAAGMHNVLVAAGTYTGSITMVGGINVTGGYSTEWVPGISPADVQVNGSLLAGGEAVAVDFPGITQPTSISTLTIRGSNATTTDGAGNGRGTYAVRMISSTGVTLSNLSITAGNAAKGNDGINGSNLTTPAATGGSGADAAQLSSSCDDTTRRSGGVGAGSGSQRGGNGGRGGAIDSNCATLNYNATPGEVGLSAASTSGTQGTGGTAGAGASTCGVGGVGHDGYSGNSGSGGFAATLGGNGSTGYWVPTGVGGSGSTGTSGGGGGGGGGSGGCDVGIDDLGAGGGGGGAGGAPSGVAGAGGRPGGWSIGVFARNSTVAVTNTTIQRGTGGQGGKGGNGGSGQPGGGGGSPGVGNGDAKNGGAGGMGGNGGASGPGAGGAGGSPYGILSSASTVTPTNVTYSGGTQGSGGFSGTGVPGGSTSVAGPNGTVQGYGAF